MELLKEINQYLSQKQSKVWKVAAKNTGPSGAFILTGEPTIVSGETSKGAFSLKEAGQLKVVPNFEDYVDRVQFDPASSSVKDVQIMTDLMIDRANEYMESRPGAIFNVYGFEVPGYPGIFYRNIMENGKYELRLCIKTFKES